MALLRVVMLLPCRFAGSPCFDSKSISWLMSEIKDATWMIRGFLWAKNRRRTRMAPYSLDHEMPI